jgi:ABC-2 type transport system ATP-binding protein
LEVAAGRKVGGFSLGMRQRLGIAAALIGDPPVLVLDEPINGLDPEGICWLRAFTQALATEGRTVFLSSHLMSEMAMTATELVVIGRGRLIAAESVTAFTERADSSVRVRSPELDRLAVALAGEVTSMWRVDDALEVTGIGIERVGAIALKLGVHLHELSPQRASLEDAFIRLTADATEYLPQRAA